MLTKTINIFLFLFIVCFKYSFAYEVSNNGKKLIKEYEKCSLIAYWDSNGYSIGYGHHKKYVRKGMKISKKQAEELFNKDIYEVNKSINRLIGSLPVKHKFSQNFIDGLGDLIYNCGESGVKNSEFYNRLKRCRKNNKSDLEFTIAAVKNLRCKDKGNKIRRYNTHKLMLK